MTQLLHVAARIGQLALWVVLLGFLVLLTIPRLTAFDVLVVRGGSMEPAIHVGSVVIVDREARAPAVGSIVSFRDLDSGIVTHRVVAVDGGRYTTQGDANQTQDAKRRTAADVYGTVVMSLALVGFVLHAIQQPPVFLVLLVGTGGLIVAGAIRTIVDEVGRILGGRRRADAD